jgi:dimeric dUTPase (all-alpha-NTP-PPase superfamily)
MDKLEQLFKMQAALNQRIGVNTDSMDEAERATWLLNYTRAMTQELAELTDSVPWKWWAKYQKFDQQNAVVELVDLLHFLISACQVMGLSAEDVFRIYTQKNAVNLERQEDGYTTKTEDDCQHIG